jgi:hypothetical protein
MKDDPPATRHSWVVIDVTGDFNELFKVVIF